MNCAEQAAVLARRMGVSVCFVNPGTTELHLVSALADAGIRSVVCLTEGVAAGAADGFARLTGQPAMVLVHQGPSLANAASNFHNARRAGSPVWCVVGDHPRSHAAHDPPLASDIERLASFFSKSVHVCTSPDDAVGEVSTSLSAALEAPPGIATLVFPADVQAATAPEAEPALVAGRTAKRVEASQVADIADALRGSGKKGALLLGGPATGTRGLAAAARLEQACGCTLLTESFPARLELAPALPRVTRVPYMPAVARGLLKQYELVVRVGAGVPVAFFAESEGNSTLLASTTRVLSLGDREHDVMAALGALAEHLDEGHPVTAAVPATPRAVAPPTRPGVFTAAEVIYALVSKIPSGAVVVDEGVSSAGLFHKLFDARIAETEKAATYLSLTGGALGQGVPCALGAALADGDRPVVTIVGDGAAMYSLQALWSCARERANVVVVVLSNRGYRILQMELMLRCGIKPGAPAFEKMALNDPDLDWVKLAEGMGVPSERAVDSDALAGALDRGFNTVGPYLIEATIA